MTDPEHIEAERTQVDRYLEHETDFKKIERHALDFGFFFRNVLPIFKGHRKRVDAMEARLSRLEQQKSSGVHWRGIHEPGRAYLEGSLVTKRGGLWLATEDTADTPGGADGAAAWRLVVKSGEVPR